MRFSFHFALFVLPTGALLLSFMIFAGLLMVNQLFPYFILKLVSKYGLHIVHDIICESLQ